MASQIFAVPPLSVESRQLFYTGGHQRDRGYLTRRASDIGGGSQWAWWIATIAVSVLFGFGHYYKGPAGILDSAVAGLILGAVYLLSKRNLWTAILAHGFIDTFAVVFTYLGLNN